jgi:hypothetical protein
MQSQRIFPSLLALSFLLALSACSGNSSGDSFSGTGGTVGAGGSAGMSGTGGATGTGGGVGGGTGAGGIAGECVEVRCPDGKLYECGNCIDDDLDERVDGSDPECLNHCDNTEGPSLRTGTPGTTGNQCGADCYFDGGNGSGNGDCNWDRRCDPLTPVDQCPYEPSANLCPAEQPPECEPGCGALTPNGCDCFGCCTFPELNGGYVFLGSEIGSDGSCTLADLTNEELCKPCTPAQNCLNTCGRCEICLGKPTIPPDCFPGTGGMGGGGGAGGDGGGMRCPVGKQVCGLPGDAPCPPASFCLTGCCSEIIVQ